MNQNQYESKILFLILVSVHKGRLKQKLMQSQFRVSLWVLWSFELKFTMWNSIKSRMAKQSKGQMWVQTSCLLRDFLYHMLTSESGHPKVPFFLRILRSKHKILQVYTSQFCGNTFFLTTASAQLTILILYLIFPRLYLTILSHIWRNWSPKSEHF